MVSATFKSDLWPHEINLAIATSLSGHVIVAMLLLVSDLAMFRRNRNCRN